MVLVMQMYGRIYNIRIDTLNGSLFISVILNHKLKHIHILNGKLMMTLRLMIIQITIMHQTSKFLMVEINSLQDGMENKHMLISI
jgi:hypothetical protein